jgi:ATP/ADP translocase
MAPTLMMMIVNKNDQHSTASFLAFLIIITLLTWLVAHIELPSDYYVRSGLAAGGLELVRIHCARDGS